MRSDSIYYRSIIVPLALVGAIIANFGAIFV